MSLRHSTVHSGAEIPRSLLTCGDPSTSTTRSPLWPHTCCSVLPWCWQRQRCCLAGLSHWGGHEWDQDGYMQQSRKQGHQYQTGTHISLTFHIMTLVLSVPWKGRERKGCTVMWADGMEGDSGTHVIDRRRWWWWRGGDWRGLCFHLLSQDVQLVPSRAQHLLRTRHQMAHLEKTPSPQR